jgi:hypothetical protein
MRVHAEEHSVARDDLKVAADPSGIFNDARGMVWYWPHLLYQLRSTASANLAGFCKLVG